MMTKIPATELKNLNATIPTGLHVSNVHDGHELCIEIAEEEYYATVYRDAGQWWLRFEGEADGWTPEGWGGCAVRLPADAAQAGRLLSEAGFYEA